LKAEKLIQYTVNSSLDELSSCPELVKFFIFLLNCTCNLQRNCYPSTTVVGIFHGYIFNSFETSQGFILRQQNGFTFAVLTMLQVNRTVLLSLTHIPAESKIVPCDGMTINGVLDWRSDLLTTYTNNSELQAITAPPLISINHKSPQQPLSLFFQPAVSSSVVPWQWL
jgi:hypothetical protein